VNHVPWCRDPCDTRDVRARSRLPKCTANAGNRRALAPRHIGSASPLQSHIAPFQQCAPIYKKDLVATPTSHPRRAAPSAPRAPMTRPVRAWALRVFVRKGARRRVTLGAPSGADAGILRAVAVSHRLHLLARHAPMQGGRGLVVRHPLVPGKRQGRLRPEWPAPLSLGRFRNGVLYGGRRPATGTTSWTAEWGATVMLVLGGGTMPVVACGARPTVNICRCESMIRCRLGSCAPSVCAGRDRNLPSRAPHEPRPPPISPCACAAARVTGKGTPHPLDDTERAEAAEPDDRTDPASELTGDMLPSRARARAEYTPTAPHPCWVYPPPPPRGGDTCTAACVKDPPSGPTSTAPLLGGACRAPTPSHACPADVVPAAAQAGLAW